MKHYLLSAIMSDGAPEAPAPNRDDVEAVSQEILAAGAWVFGGGLNAPGTATVVRVRDGEVLTTDGPFAEGKEYVAGITIVTAPDLDVALDWGRKYARALSLPIEVRPFAEVRHLGDGGED